MKCSAGWKSKKNNGEKETPGLGKGNGTEIALRHSRAIRHWLADPRREDGRLGRQMQQRIERLHWKVVAKRLKQSISGTILSLHQSMTLD